MDTKDAFYTVAHAGGYIHGCYNRTQKKTEVRVQFADGATKPVKSYRAAQLALNAAQLQTNATSK